MEEKKNKSRGAYMTGYVKKTYDRYEVRINKKNESDLVEWLNKIPNVQKYIKDLIRKDMQ